MSVKLLAALLTLCVFAPHLLAAPVITVKCEEPKGKYSSYGEQAGVQNQDDLKAAEVKWSDRSYQGGSPMFIMSDDFEGQVIIEYRPHLESIKKEGFSKQQAEEMLEKQPRLGQIVAYSGEHNLWVQIYEKSQHGIAIYTLDSKTRTMVYSNSLVDSDMSGGRSLSSWTYTSQCAWFEVAG